MKAKVVISQPTIDINSGKESLNKIETYVSFATVLKGQKGDDGEPAKINGRNAITIEEGNNIEIEETTGGIKINATAPPTFFVNFDIETESFDKTFSEVLAAYNNGVCVIARMPFFGVDVDCPLNAVMQDESSLSFSFHYAGEGIHVDAQIVYNSDGITETSEWYPSWSDIQNKPDFATVATSGSYNDLSNKPTIPSKTSDLTNDSGFITTYTETDPTVPNWAKQANKPTYTASEVGALPSSTIIPSALTTSEINEILNETE